VRPTDRSKRFTIKRNVKRLDAISFVWRMTGGGGGRGGEIRRYNSTSEGKLKVSEGLKIRGGIVVFKLKINQVGGKNCAQGTKKVATSSGRKGIQGKFEAFRQDER